MATGDEHFMHLLQAGSSVKDAGVRRQIEQRTVAFLDAESAVVDFSPVVETEEDTATEEEATE